MADLNSMSHRQRRMKTAKSTKTSASESGQEMQDLELHGKGKGLLRMRNGSTPESRINQCYNFAKQSEEEDKLANAGSKQYIPKIHLSRMASYRSNKGQSSM